MQIMQELRRQHGAELQQAKLEQAPLQAVCVVLLESKRKDLVPLRKQTGSYQVVCFGKIFDK